MNLQELTFADLSALKVEIDIYLNMFTKNNELTNFNIYKNKLLKVQIEINKRLEEI